MNTYEFSYGHQTPHLPRKPLLKQGDACGSEDIQEQKLASLTVYTIFKGRLSSENQDFLPCPKTVLPMSYSLHCFSIPTSNPPGGASPTPRHETLEMPAGTRWALCVERFKTVFLSFSPGSAGSDTAIWQEKSSLLILASGSPPRQQQLNRCGKPGRAEVRAGRTLPSNGARAAI